VGKALADNRSALANCSASQIKMPKYIAIDQMLSMPAQSAMNVSLILRILHSSLAGAMRATLSNPMR
jgi:hypothetical protein